MAAAEDKVSYPHCSMSQDQTSACLTRASLLRLSKGKITTAQSFPTGNDYAFVATEGDPWPAAQTPQVMAAIGGAAETLAFHRGGEKGGKHTICEPDTNSSG